MLNLILAVYIGLCLLFFGNALHWLASRDGRPHATPGVDYLLLIVVGAVSSAAWLLLLPVYAWGWVRSARGRKVIGKLLQPLRGVRAAKLPGAPLHEHA